MISTSAGFQKVKLLLMPVFLCLIALLTVISCDNTPTLPPDSTPQSSLSESSLTPPHLLSPHNHAVDVELTPVLLWNEAIDAKGYELWIARDYEFSDMIHSVSLGGATYQVYDDLTPSTTYYWMVMVKIDSADSESSVACSQVFTFTTCDSTPQSSSSVPTSSILLRSPRNPEIMKFYITPNDPEIKAAVSDILSGESRRWVFTDFEALRDWVAWHVSYKFDQDVHGVTDYWQLPAETLELGTGDCEDFAILLCSLLRAYGVPSDQVYVAVGFSEDKNQCHAYLVEKWYQGVWRVAEPQMGAWAGVFMGDWATSVSYEELYCFNDQGYIEGSPALPSGVYEFEVDNSLYPITRGATVEFERHLNVGEKVTASFEWLKDYAIVSVWSFTIYAPDGSIVLMWSGTDLQRDFSFTATATGIYRVEILKRDALARCARLRIDPPNWTQR